MSTTPLQKCALSLQQKFALAGKRITTAQAVKQCSKKFPVRETNKKEKGWGTRAGQISNVRYID